MAIFLSYRVEAHEGVNNLLSQYVVSILVQYIYIYTQVNVNTQYDFGVEYILKQVCRITEIRKVKRSE